MSNKLYLWENLNSLRDWKAGTAFAFAPTQARAILNVLKYAPHAYGLEEELAEKLPQIFSGEQEMGAALYGQGT